MAEKKTEIIEVDVKQIEKLRAFTKADKDLRLSNGILYTHGCNGDFGCCSDIFDLDELLFNIERQIK